MRRKGLLFEKFQITTILILIKVIIIIQNNLSQFFKEIVILDIFYSSGQNEILFKFGTFQSTFTGSEMKLLTGIQRGVRNFLIGNFGIRFLDSENKNPRNSGFFCNLSSEHTR